jgi:hypothetical protein
MKWHIDLSGRLALQAPPAKAVILGLWMLAALAAQVEAGAPQDRAQPSKQSTPKLWLLLNEPKAFQGYTLVAPLVSTKTYLIDMRGRVIRTWESNYTAGQDAYLLENGHLLRAARLDSKEQLFAGAGQGGRVQEFTWEGKLVWDFKFHNAKQISHHDVARLPNGNVLLIVWEIKTAEETIAAGRRRERVAGPWLVDSIVEIKPTGMTTGEVVWEWHMWDHLIQDNDSAKANYGEVGAHPELIDVNFDQDLVSPLPRVAQSPKQEEKRKDTLNKLRGIGYVGTAAARGNLGLIADWTHVNSVAYNADLDQVMISVRGFNEFWIIDHSTSSAEAASHTGGRSGKGGDLLYRWGNPRAYRAGTAKDQRLFAQHDAHWIPRGRPGEGHALVFNNGTRRPGGSYSSVDEIILPVDSQGRYNRRPGSAYGPPDPVWSYAAPKKSDFNDWIMSGAQRLPNGNTLICDSMKATLFEVTPEKEIVWKYINSDKGGSPPGGAGRPGSRPGGFGGPGAFMGAFFGGSVFRAYRYAPDYPGLAGKDLTPGKTIEELQAKELKGK